jgi:hypothetical protein
MRRVDLRTAAMGALALGSMFVWTEVSAAAVPKPNDARCQKWVLQSPAKGNWVGAPVEKWWLCVEGAIKGATASASRTRGSVTSPTVTSPTVTPPTVTPVTVNYPGNSTANRNDIGRAQRKGNNGRGTGSLDGGDPPGGGNTGNDPN